MEDHGDGLLQLISAEIIFDNHGWVNDNHEFNWFNYINASVNIGIETGDEKGRPLHLISVDVFENF